MLEAGSTLLREQVLLLGSDEVRAVDGEQRIALLHRLARVVDIEVLDVAAYLEGHFGDLPLVVVEAPHGPNDLLDGSPLDAAEGEPDHLALSGVEVDRCLRKARGVVAGNLPRLERAGGVRRFRGLKGAHQDDRKRHNEPQVTT